MRAIWNGETIAESDETIVVEGNHYFPAESLKREYVRRTRIVSLCPWKGVARYYTLEVADRRLEHAAWYYPRPWPWIRKIRGRVAFWGGVQVVP